MVLSRSFRQQSWFVRLNTGEIDLLEGSAVERALGVGGLSLDTPVCAVGTEVWLPLKMLAAKGDLSDELGQAGEVAVAAPEGPWRIRERQLGPIAPRRTRLFIGFGLAAAAAIFLVVRTTSALTEVDQRRATAVVQAPVLPVVEEEVTPPPPPRPKPSETLTQEQKRRLRVMDARAKAANADLHRLRAQDWARVHKSGMTPPKPDAPKAP